MNNDWWDYLRHSSKGSTWSSHKYIKKVGDKLKYKRIGEDRTKEALDVWGGYTLIEKEIR